MSSLLKSTRREPGLVSRHCGGRAGPVGFVATTSERRCAGFSASGHPSTPLVGPKPGSGAVWQEQHYQAPPNYEADKSLHPYSTPIGPKPGSYSSGPEEHYQATQQDELLGRHPYTMPGVGPRPGGG